MTQNVVVYMTPHKKLLRTFGNDEKTSPKFHQLDIVITNHRTAGSAQLPIFDPLS